MAGSGIVISTPWGVINCDILAGMRRSESLGPIRGDAGSTAPPRSLGHGVEFLLLSRCPTAILQQCRSILWKQWTNPAYLPPDLLRHGRRSPVWAAWTRNPRTLNQWVPLGSAQCERRLDAQIWAFPTLRPPQLLTSRTLSLERVLLRAANLQQSGASPLCEPTSPPPCRTWLSSPGQRAHR